MSLSTIKRALFLLLTLIIVGVVVMGIVSLFNLFAPKPRYTFQTNSRTVIKQLRDLNRLETSQFTIEKVIDAGTNGNTFQQFLFGDKILLIAQGEVIAGFDLAKLSDQDVIVEGTTLRLTLPQAEILVTKLNNEQTRVYDRKLGILSKGDKDLESLARDKAENLIKQAACDGNILDEASTNARNQLTALFKTFGFTTVIITIPASSC